MFGILWSVHTVSIETCVTCTVTSNYSSTGKIAALSKSLQRQACKIGSSLELTCRETWMTTQPSIWFLLSARTTSRCRVLELAQYSSAAFCWRSDSEGIQRENKCQEISPLFFIKKFIKKRWINNCGTIMKKNILKMSLMKRNDGFDWGCGIWQGKAIRGILCFPETSLAQAAIGNQHV